MADNDAVPETTLSTTAAKTVPKVDIDEASRWARTIKDARTFDENARRNYARDRAYAKNDTGGYEVDVPVASSYISVKVAFLYARNPDLDIQPAPATQPPPMSDIMEMARQEIGQDPATHAKMIEVGTEATVEAQKAINQATLGAAQTALGDATASKNLPAPPPGPPPEQVGELAAQAWLTQTIKAKAKEIMAPYRERQSQAKQFGDTLDLVIQNQWEKAKLKHSAKKFVRSSATIGPGWLKATWQERKGWDPVIEKRHRDAVAQAERMAALEASIARNEVKDREQAEKELSELQQGLTANVEELVDRSLVIDFVRGEDIQVAPGVALEDYLEAPWIDHRSFMPAEDAKAKFPDIAAQMGKATLYYQRKLPAPEDADKLQMDTDGFDPQEADAFRTAGDVGDTDNMPSFVCIHETWDLNTHLVRTTVEGTAGWACKPYVPDPGTTRFFPFFYLSLIETDGERHPQSHIGQTRKLLDEVNRQYSNLAEHRRRSLPKTAVNAGDLSNEELEKVTKGGVQEILALRPTDPEAKVADLIAPLKYAGIDPNLYNDKDTFNKLELRWGIQEALASGTNPTQKTATEAEISQSGTSTRTAEERDSLDTVLTDLANYSAQILVQKLSLDEVKEIVGPWAFWPEGLTMKQFSTLLTIKIKGGSTGKPDTARQQSAWAATYPLLNQAITEIGQLRQSSPDDIADCKEELMVETLNKSGERLEPSRFMPPPPSNEPGNMPQTPPPGVNVPPIPSSMGAHTPRPIKTPPAEHNPQSVVIPHH